jgi:hypothetical protein
MSDGIESEDTKNIWRPAAANITERGIFYCMMYDSSYTAFDSGSSSEEATRGASLSLLNLRAQYSKRPLSLCSHLPDLEAGFDPVTFEHRHSKQFICIERLEQYLHSKIHGEAITNAPCPLAECGQTLSYQEIHDYAETVPPMGTSRKGWRFRFKACAAGNP